MNKHYLSNFDGVQLANGPSNCYEPASWKFSGKLLGFLIVFLVGLSLQKVRSCVLKELLVTMVGVIVETVKAQLQSQSSC